MSSPASEPAECENCPMKAEVKSLIYWRKPLRSAAVLAILLTLQISFMCCSAISIVAYAGFLMFASINLCRLYYHYVAKTESQLIKDFIESDMTIPKDRISNVTHRLTDMVNDQLLRMRDVFLVTDIGASIKFGVLLYLMTYVGARFNFLTLCIIATLLAFFVPKFYESYQSEIDRVLKVLKEKADKAMTQINAKLEKLPILGGKKKAQ